MQVIFNAAVNASQGAGAVPPNFKPLFKHNNNQFDVLIDRQRPIALKRRLIFEKGVLLLSLYHFWLRFFGQSMGNLFCCFSTTITCRFSNKVLIEQGELNLL